MKAMIFAAGLGTRLQNETADKPKALVEINGKPLIHYAIKKVSELGVSDIVVNVHHFAAKVCNYIYEFEKDIPIQISDESDQLLETGGGLKKAAPLLSSADATILYNVDILSNIDLEAVVDYHKKNNALATLVVRDRPTQRYFKFNKQGQITGWTNIKTGEKKVVQPESFADDQLMAFSGIHIISNKIFDYLPSDNVFSITNWYLDLAKEHKIIGYYDQSDIWMDVGKPQQLLEARALFNH